VRRVDELNVELYGDPAPHLGIWRMRLPDWDKCHASECAMMPLCANYDSRARHDAVEFNDAHLLPVDRK
jgi:hypothetical protein